MEKFYDERFLSYNKDTSIIFLRIYNISLPTSFQGPFLEWTEGKGPGTGWHLLQFHWSITLHS